MAISNLSDCSATEPFLSIRFQIINEVSLKDDLPRHRTQTNGFSHRWYWDVSTIFAKSIRFSISFVD